MVSLCTTLAKKTTTNGNGGHNPHKPTQEEVQKRITFARSMSDSGFESKVIIQPHTKIFVACFIAKNL